jgi:hypothetical protein
MKRNKMVSIFHSGFEACFAPRPLVLGFKNTSQIKILRHLICKKKGGAALEIGMYWPLLRRRSGSFATTPREHVRRR